MEMSLLREIIWTRCKGYCEKCGIQMPEDNWALHHRQLRSRGGTDSPDNCVALHHGCHNLKTDSVHNNPYKSTLSGLMVSAWSDPAECPVTLPNGDIVILKPEGNYHYLERKANVKRTTHNPSRESW